MRRSGLLRRTAGGRMMVTVLALGLLVASPAWTRDTKSGSEQVVEGAREVGRGVEATAKGIGTTVTQGAKEVGSHVQSAAKQAEKGAKPVADRLHDGAKGFGEAIWDAMRYVGQTLEAFFTGKK